MIHTKLSIRRWAYGPWLLAAGLVLGWSEDAVAVSSSTSGHSTAANHPHATNPNLILTYDLNSSGTDHSITVNWSTSRSRNFSTGNGEAATMYAVSLYSGEIDSDLSSPSDTQIGTEQSYSGASVGTRTYSFTDAAIKYEGEEGGATGNYWVRMEVTVTSTDVDHATSVQYFAKQITARADYILSVNPNSIREDARRTSVTVKVKVGNDVAVTKNTNVNLRFSIPPGKLGLNDRFYIVMPTLAIAKGKKEATGTLIFTPISEDTENEDLAITISGDATAQEAVKPAVITLIDTDKQSDAINLSFSDSDLSKRDGTIDIVVTATLNGKTQRRDLRFSLVIDETRGLERDVDYTAVMARITIPDRKVSGRATISIRPKNAGTGSIWIGASADVDLTNDDGATITVNPNFIDITGDPAGSITGLTAAPFSVREDAGEKTITLKVSLENALVAAERVQFTITDDSDDLGEAFAGAVDAERDVDYAAEVGSLTIPKGATEGTTTMTVTPVNNKDDDPPRAFKVNARVGNNESFVAGILITDDDTTSDSITLEAEPAEINEDAGPTEITVTGTLNGKVFDDNVIVSLVVDNDVNDDGDIDDDDMAATRDADYTAILRPLVIPAGAVSGTTTVTVTPIANDGEEDDEKFRLATLESRPPRGEDDGDLQELEVNPVTITLKDVEDSATPSKTPDPKVPAFASADSVAAQEYEVGKAIADLVLPEATGGDGTLTYSVSTLPAGLTFNSSTRTLSGTPIVVGTSTIVYTVIDSDSDAAALTFPIAVAAASAPEPAPAPPPANAALTASPSSVREDAEATQVFLTATLPAPKATPERVTFTLVGPSAGTPAVRDLDYTAILGKKITIPAGATVGTTAFPLTPIDNTAVDGAKALGVQAAFSSGGVLLTNIEIADDETPSTSISLSVNPRTISEEGAEVSVAVTATLDGKALLADATVRLTIDGTSTATRDEDYAALFNPLLVIPAGWITGSTLFAVRPIDDTVAEGNEIIKLTGTIAGLAGDEVEIILSDRGTEEPPEEPEPEDPAPEDPSLAFADDVSIADQRYTAERPVPALVLPAASGGSGGLQYSVSALPAGLSFDAATRTVSGTPAEATEDAVVIIYTVIDSDGAAAALTFTIKVNPPLSFAALFDLFNSMAGKVVPTAAPNAAEIREFVVGRLVEGLALPEGTGGTAPLTYRLSPALPAGLSFDATTRTIAGTPRAAAEPVYTYTVTDANGASASLALHTRPAEFALAANFPNPFNPATTIQYALPQAADVDLMVYNVVGQPVRTLVADHQSAGRYVVEWDATDDSGRSLSSGLYFYRLQAGGEFRAIKKMLLLK